MFPFSHRSTKTDKVNRRVAACLHGNRLNRALYTSLKNAPNFPLMSTRPMWPTADSQRPIGEGIRVWRRPLTVPDLLHDEPVEADLVDALVQAVGLVDVQHLAVQPLQLRVAQIRTQDLIVELLWKEEWV